MMMSPYLKRDNQIDTSPVPYWLYQDERAGLWVGSGTGTTTPTPAEQLS